MAMDTAFRALAEPRRREILKLVWSEELPAAEIHAAMDGIRRFLDEYWSGSLLRLQHLAESAEREKGTTDG
jgi:DNA-binding transcriptional ArsR family regulator